MFRNFKELQARLSPEARRRSEALEDEMRFDQLLMDLGESKEAVKKFLLDAADHVFITYVSPTHSLHYGAKMVEDSDAIFLTAVNSVHCTKS